MCQGSALFFVDVSAMCVCTWLCGRLSLSDPRLCTLLDAVLGALVDAVLDAVLDAVPDVVPWQASSKTGCSCI
jgi:hypothetical protein